MILAMRQSLEGTSGPTVAAARNNEQCAFARLSDTARIFNGHNESSTKINRVVANTCASSRGKT